MSDIGQTRQQGGRCMVHGMWGTYRRRRTLLASCLLVRNLNPSAKMWVVTWEASFIIHSGERRKDAEHTSKHRSHRGSR